jgi:hypothetical protein
MQLFPLFSTIIFDPCFHILSALLLLCCRLNFHMYLYLFVTGYVGCIIELFHFPVDCCEP